MDHLHTITSLRDTGVAAVLDAFRTCELATLSRSGTPITWPTSALFRPEDGTFVLTTSVALAAKAANIRRDGRVGLLFSNPRASGLEGAPQVLVQGTATCSDEVVTSPAGLGEYWTRLLERQPISRTYSRFAPTRRLMDWYYRRLVVTVVPTRVHVRPALEPAGTAPAPAGTGLVEQAARELARFDSAVLSGRDAVGSPWLLRVRPTVRPGATSLDVAVPDGEPLQPGPASLLAHSHDDRLWSLRAALVTGHLARDDARWSFTPERVLPDRSREPLHAVRLLRDSRRAAARYLQRHGLEAEPIPWDLYAPLRAEAQRRERAARTAPAARRRG